LTFAFTIQPVVASETIYIQANGSIDPPTASIQRDGDVYTLTDNIFGSTVVVARSNIAIDGNSSRFKVLEGAKVLLWRG
jgi:hypothetical protein